MERPNNPKKCLLPSEIQAWLFEHIPYRLAGSIALTPIADEWDLARNSVLRGGGFKFACANLSILQGQHAAIRWLIEFVGIQRDKHKNPVQSRAALEQEATDCGIWLLPHGANMLDTHPGAQVLADIWKGCAQAVTHPTVATGYPEIWLPHMLPALRYIVEFLQEGVYRDYKLSHVVHE